MHSKSFISLIRIVISLSFCDFVKIKITQKKKKRKYQICNFLDQRVARNREMIRKNIFINRMNDWVSEG